MALYCICFSPTGGTRKCAGLLSEGLGSARCIDITVHSTAREFYADDVCIVAVPSYAGRVPAIAAQRLRAFRGNGAKAVAMVVFGNRAIDDTLLELKNELNAAGFVTIAGVEAVTEHSIVRSFGAGRPDADDTAELLSFAERIKEKLSRGAADVEVPGNYPYKPYGSSPMKPTGGETCDSCGRCAEECPVGAINPAAPQGVDASVCIICMRCISLCPIGARSLPQDALNAAAARMAAVCGGHKNNALYL